MSLIGIAGNIMMLDGWNGIRIVWGAKEEEEDLLGHGAVKFSLVFSMS